MCGHCKLIECDGCPPGTQKAPIKGLVSTAHLAVGTTVYTREGNGLVQKCAIKSVYIGDEIKYCITFSNYQRREEELFLTADEAFKD